MILMQRAMWKNVSANYLSSLMLQQTNLKMSRYNEFLLNMRNEVPALNANGYVDKDGKNHELSENNEYTKTDHTVSVSTV